MSLTMICNNNTLSPEILQQIFTLVDIKYFGKVALVCKTFQANIENSQFLRLCFLNLKGKSFKIEDGIDPRNFLVLDRDLTHTFKVLIKSNKKLEEKINGIVKGFHSICVADYTRRTFAMKNGKVIDGSEYIFRFSTKALSFLKTVSWKDKVQWKSHIDNLVQTLASYHYPTQIHYHFPEAIYHLQALEKKFCNPDEKMKALITEYGVDQMFFKNESTLLICASKGNELKPEVLEEAVLEPKQYERWLNFQLIKSFEDSISIVCSDDRPGEIGIICNHEIRHKIFQRLLEQSKGMKELMQDKLSKQLLKLCKDIFFREIWHTEPEDSSLPKSLEQPEDAEEKREFDLFMNFLMVKSFENSIKYVPRNPETPHIVDITCDPNLCSLLYRRLQDPSTGLKEYIEKAFKDNQRLLIYQDLFFWKIWHSEPFVPSKPVSITAVVSNGNILPANNPQ